MKMALFQWYLIWVLSFFLLMGGSPPPSFAKESPSASFQKAMSAFQEGDYPVAIELFKKVVRENPKDPSALHHLSESYAKAQRHEEAVKSYLELIRRFGSYENSYYELGQSYFALQDLEKADAAFRESVKDKRMLAQAFFYRGYLLYLKGEVVKARKVFLQLKKRFKDSKIADERSMAQSAILYIGLTYKEETREEKITDSKKETLMDHAEDYFEEAIEMDKKASPGIQAEKELASLQKERAKAFPKSLFVRGTFSTFYDSNVTSEANGAETKSANKDAPGLSASLFAMFSKKGPWDLDYRPAIIVSGTRHFSNTKAVYGNDSMDFNPRVGVSKSMGDGPKKNILSFDYDFNLNLLDRNENHHLLYNSRTHTFTPSYSFNIFSIGSTSLGTPLKFDTRRSASQSAIKPSVNLSQFFKLNSTMNLSLNAGYEYAQARGDSYDARTLSGGLRVTKTFPKEWTLTGAVSLSSPDYYKIPSTRGREKSWSITPSVSHIFEKNWMIAVKYNYTDNQSPRAKSTYDYTKDVFTAELTYNY